MNNLSLTQMAIELLQINEKFLYYVQNPMKTKVSDFTLHTFVQVWGSTSGGFEGIGGSAITTQRTYVFIPINNINEKCLVFFGSRFAYAVPCNTKFITDVENKQMASVHDKRRYLE